MQLLLWICSWCQEQQQTTEVEPPVVLLILLSQYSEQDHQCVTNRIRKALGAVHVLSLMSKCIAETAQPPLFHCTLRVQQQMFGAHDTANHVWCTMQHMQPPTPCCPKQSSGLHKVTLQGNLEGQVLHFMQLHCDHTRGAETQVHHAAAQRPQQTVP